MDDVRDGIFTDCCAKSGKISDIPLDELDLSDFGVGKDLSQSPRVFLEVEDPDLIAASEQIANDPGTDKSIAAGDQDAHEGLQEALMLQATRCSSFKPSIVAAFA
jgi:hypothetical protein